MPASFGDTFVAAFTAVATVLCTAGVGAYGAKRGLLPKAALKHLDKLVSEILTPCMVFYKVCPNASGEALAAVWPMTVMAALTVFFGLGSGWIASRVLGNSYPESFPKFSGLLMVACGFPNTLAVPLTLQMTLVDQAVFLSPETPTVEAVRDRSLQLFMFSYVVWILLRWSVGFPVLTGAFTDFHTWLQKMLNPPTIACLIALPLGLINGWLGPDFPRGWLGPAGSAMEYGAQALVPIIQFSLGAKMYLVVLELQEEDAAEGQDKSGTLPKAEAAEAGGAAYGELQSVVELEEGAEGSVGVKPPRATLPPERYLVIVVLRQGGSASYNISLH